MTSRSTTVAAASASSSDQSLEDSHGSLSDLTECRAYPQVKVLHVGRQQDAERYVLNRTNLEHLNKLLPANPQIEEISFRSNLSSFHDDNVRIECFSLFRQTRARRITFVGDVSLTPNSTPPEDRPDPQQDNGSTLAFIGLALCTAIRVTRICTITFQQVDFSSRQFINCLGASNLLKRHRTFLQISFIKCVMDMEIVLASIRLNPRLMCFKLVLGNNPARDDRPLVKILQTLQSESFNLRKLVLQFWNWESNTIRALEQLLLFPGSKLALLVLGGFTGLDDPRLAPGSELRTRLWHAVRRNTSVRQIRLDPELDRDIPLRRATKWCQTFAPFMERNKHLMEIGNQVEERTWSLATWGQALSALAQRPVDAAASPMFRAMCFLAPDILGARPPSDDVPPQAKRPRTQHHPVTVVAEEETGYDI